MPEERLKLAVFIDFDNIQIGVKDTLAKEFDVSVVLEALKERGEVVAKIAYGDWPRAGEQSRQMTQHAVQMVQRNVTPRGDKNGADINLALDALEMAFTRHHINAFAIVGGDSDFIALVEKLKQYDKRVFVVGGRGFTSNILQKNCTEFIAYENLLKSPGGDGGRASRGGRRSEGAGRGGFEQRALEEAMPNIGRALQILADRGVAPQLGLLKSTLLQLDSTFSEKDYGAGSFLEFMLKLERVKLVHLRRVDRAYLVEPAEVAGEAKTEASGATPSSASPLAGTPSVQGESEGEVAAVPQPADSVEQPSPTAPPADALALLKRAMVAATQSSPNRPLYLRQVRQRLRAADPAFDERHYGFRSTLDLVHQAQREGWVRIQRDRTGVSRVYLQATSLTAVEAPALLPGVDSAAEGSSAPARAAVAVGPVEFLEAAETVAEVVPSEGGGVEESIEGAESASSEEPAPEPKLRRPRPPRRTARTTTRRVRSRSKEPAKEETLPF